MIIKEKLQDIPSLQLSGSVFTIWMIPSFIILFFSGFFSEFEASPAQMEALGYLGILTVLGTTIAIILYYRLIQNTSAVFASTVTYLLPIIAVIWGILDGEEFSLWYIIGGILILFGIYLIQEKPVIIQSEEKNPV